MYKSLSQFSCTGSSGSWRGGDGAVAADYTSQHLHINHTLNGTASLFSITVFFADVSKNYFMSLRLCQGEVPVHM